MLPPSDVISPARYPRVSLSLLPHLFASLYQRREDPAIKRKGLRGEIRFQVTIFVGFQPRNIPNFSALSIWNPLHDFFKFGLTQIIINL